MSAVSESSSDGAQVHIIHKPNELTLVNASPKKITLPQQLLKKRESADIMR